MPATAARTEAVLHLYHSDPNNEGLLLHLINTTAEEVAWSLLIDTLGNLPDPEHYSPPANAQIGFACMCCQLFELAESHIENAIEHGVRDTHVTYNLAYCKTMLSKPAESMALVSQIEQERPLNLAETVLKARALMNDGNTQQATQLLLNEYHNDSFTAESLGLLALGLQDINNTDVQVETFARKAIEINNKALEAHLAIGALQTARNEFDAAYSNYLQLTDWYPTCGQAWSGLGQVEYSELRFAEAENALLKATKYMPDHIGTWHLLGWSQALLGQPQEALTTFKSALELDRNFGESHGNIACGYCLLGEYHSARRHLKLAHKLAPFSLSSVMAEMLILEGEGKHVEAMQLFDKAKNTEYPQLNSTPKKLADARMSQILSRLKERHNA